MSSVSETAVAVMVKNTSTELTRDDIRTVHLVNGNSAKKGALIGLGVGAGVGAAFGAIVDVSNNDDLPDFDIPATPFTTILGAGVGAISGFFIGRAGKKRVLLYEAK